MKIKTSKGDRTFQVINILIFAIFAIICAYPFYYLIINSISANDLSASGKVNFLPHGFQLENYVKVFQLNGLGTAAMVSLGRTVIGTICTVLASVYLGFMFTQQRMWHRKLWYRFMVITMYFNAGLIRGTFLEGLTLAIRSNVRCVHLCRIIHFLIHSCDCCQIHNCAPSKTFPCTPENHLQPYMPRHCRESLTVLRLRQGSASLC